jgi:hypothetical protein
MRRTELCRGGGGSEAGVDSDADATPGTPKPALAAARVGADVTGVAAYDSVPPLPPVTGAADDTANGPAASDRAGERTGDAGWGIAVDIAPGAAPDNDRAGDRTGDAGCARAAAPANAIAPAASDDDSDSDDAAARTGLASAAAGDV